MAYVYCSRIRREELRGLPASIRVIEDEQVAEAILRTAQKAGVDIIIMSAHGHGSVRRWLLGSIADRLLRQTTVPVLLIRVVEDNL
jgi:nucleotide-binding universal stress UspA family protein